MYFDFDEPAIPRVMRGSPPIIAYSELRGCEFYSRENFADVCEAPDVKGLREYADPPAALIGTPPLMARI